MEKLIEILVRLVRAGYAVTFEPNPNSIGESVIAIGSPNSETNGSLQFLIKFDLLFPEHSIAELADFVDTFISSGEDPA